MSPPRGPASPPLFGSDVGGGVCPPAEFLFTGGARKGGLPGGKPRRGDTRRHPFASARPAHRVGGGEEASPPGAPWGHTTARRAGGSGSPLHNWRGRHRPQERAHARALLQNGNAPRRLRHGWKQHDEERYPEKNFHRTKSLTRKGLLLKLQRHFVPFVTSPTAKPVAQSEGISSSPSVLSSASSTSGDICVTSPVSWATA